MKTKLTTPWLNLVGDIWRVNCAHIFFCNNFWDHFDWNPPRAGEQMRIVMSATPVRGAQHTRLMRTDTEWNWSGHKIFMNETDDLLDSFFEIPDGYLDNRYLKVFDVYWWPEYR